ncbi:MAG: flagellar assembly protein FliW [Treponema sp.]|nr:flagellar assembly protein FliW [Treponema sp.]
MKLATKAYGLIDVDEKQKIIIPEGLFGFEDIKEYALLDAESGPFYWLQSLSRREIAFVLINPFLFRPDYEVDISNEEMLEIGVTSAENALVFALVTIPADGSPITANLQGPLLINKESRIAKQAVLADPRRRTRHDIAAEMNPRENQ